MSMTDFRSTSAVPTRASTLPARASLATVVGDSFTVTLTFTDEATGDLIDCTGWGWLASISDGTTTIDFQITAFTNGCQLSLAGSETMRLPTTGSLPFDVAAFQPGAVDGRVVLAGTMTAESRVTKAQAPT